MVKYNDKLFKKVKLGNNAEERGRHAFSCIQNMAPSLLCLQVFVLLNKSFKVQKKKKKKNLDYSFLLLTIN